MKKLLAFAMSLVILTSITGCSGGQNTAETTAARQTAQLGRQLQKQLQKRLPQPAQQRIPITIRSL